MLQCKELLARCRVIAAATEAKNVTAKERRTMHKFERVYMRTLRHVYDTEKQLIVAMASIAGSVKDQRLVHAAREIARQSNDQLQRIERLFAVLYLEPRSDASWVATALLREAWDSCSGVHEGGTQGCAAALLALKRYEITLYEALLRWSEQFGLDEAIGDIRRSIAEELVQASILSDLAFIDEDNLNPALPLVERAALH
jgi:ferritin-like metal-binding protein YciE